MAVTNKAYFDGSGNLNNPQNKYITLAGYVGSPGAWDEFDQRWTTVLQSGKCPYLHMTDALTLRGVFTESKGWSQERVLKLIQNLFNECLSPLGWVHFRNEFRGISCTINLTDYIKAKTEIPELKESESICVDFVLTVALESMPDDRSLTPFGKEGTLEVFFDRNEPFINKVYRVWINKPKGPLSLVSNIAQLDSRQLAGLQAADLLAWSTNRYYTHGMNDPIGSFAGALRVFATPMVGEYYDYSKLKKEFGVKT